MEETNKHLVSEEANKPEQIRTIRRRPVVAPNSKSNSITSVPSIKHKKPRVAPVVEAYTVVEADAVDTPVVDTPVDEMKEDNKLVKHLDDCIKLFDPCTKEPIDSLEALEKRIRDIKKQRNTTAIGLYDLNNKTSNYDFLMNVFCNKDISLDDMVSFKLQEGGQKGSDIYEVLCRLFVIFGGIKDINIVNGDYKIMLKIEDPTSIFDDLKAALQSMECKASNKMGVSDITLIKNKTTNKDISPYSPYCEIDCDVKDPDKIKTYLMSVKWYQKEKGGEHYDLEKLFLAGQELVSEEKSPFGIIVFLKSKLEFQKAHNRSYRQYVSRIANTFFGWNEDVKPFLEDIRKTLFQNADILQTTDIQEVMNSQYFISSAKPILPLYLHQELIITGINDALHNNPTNDKRYVIGVLPRGGKTYIAGGIVREFINRNKFSNSNKINILWITAAPNETRSQVGNELILKYQDFDSFNFVDIKNLTDFSGKQPNPNTVWFCSIQLLTLTKAGKAKERAFLNKLLEGSDEDNKINMIFFDEAHAGGAGLENKKIIDKLIENYSNNIPFIFLTATYLSIIHEYSINTKTNLFVWDYTDVIKTRAIATESERDNAIYNLKLRFTDELVTKIINKRLANTDSYEAMAKPYLDFPELNFISCDFNEEAKERFAKQDLYNPNRGFSLSAIFGLRPDYSSFKIKTADGKRIRKDAYKIFMNLENPRNLISLLTPSDPTQSFNFEASGGEPFTVKNEYEQTILKRIERISYQTGSRFRLDERPTLLMFLPTGGIGSNISKLLPAFASLLMSHQWWNTRYEVACIISDSDKNPSDVDLAAAIAEDAEPADNIEIIDDNLKMNILKKERELHCNKNKGLIILAGERLSMGISLPCTDCVFLLNETKSPDSIIQKLYRALTPSNGKKSSFVVDLNPLRSLSAVYGYTRAAYETAVTKSNILDIIYDVYSWDEDIINLRLEKGGSERIASSKEILGDMLEKASKDRDFDDVFKNIGNFEKKLESNITKKTNELGLIPLLKTITIDKIITKDGIKFSDKANIIVKKGQLIIRIEKESNSESKNNNETENKKSDVEDVVIIHNFTQAVADFIKYLALTSQENTLEEAINEFESNIMNNSGKSLQMNVFDLLKAREAIKEYIYLPDSKLTIKNPIDKSIIIKLFIDVVKKYSPDTSSEIFRQMRGKIDEPSVRKNEVLKIIHRHLTPKKSQKEKHGEVFTPINIVEDMLNHLPKSIWSDPDLKFLDPANGIGNFPIFAFYKLNEGLKSVIPNEDKRKKHIIDNMLYMTEIQSNNTRIAKNIFSKLCNGCKPNIWTTDSLKLTSETLKKHEWPEQYDIIMGNPPFNAGGLLKGGGTLWPKFVYLAFDLIKPNGYITYIHPPGWRKFYDPEDRDNQGKIWYTIKENGWHLEYINISDKSPQHFPLVDYYVIKAGKSAKQTTYDSLFMTIKDSGTALFTTDFIPNMINSDTQHIIDKLFSMKGDDINIVYNQSFKPSKADEGKKGILHYHFTDRTGNKKYYNKTYTNIPDYINHPKVLMTFSGGYEKGKLFAFYTDEQIGTTNNSMYIIVQSKAEGEKIANFLNSNIITFLLKITQYSASPNHKNEFKILNQLKVPKSIDNYNLTKSEKELISSIVGATENSVSEGGSKRFNNTRKNKK